MSKFKKIMTYVGASMLVIVPIGLAMSVLLPTKIPSFGLNPVQMGIDLKGGAELVLKVDESSIDKLEKQSVTSFLEKTYQLHQESKTSDTLIFTGKLDSKEQDLIGSAFSMRYPSLSLSKMNGGYVVSGFVSSLKHETGQAIAKNIQILQSRLNSIGVADITMYRQGDDKIVVDLPQGDIVKEAKNILSSSAQLGFYSPDPKGVDIPFKGAVVKRSKAAFLSGDHVVDAFATLSQSSGLPTVSIRLDAAGGDTMMKYTTAHIGKMIISTITDAKYIDGVRHQTEKMASYARISGAFGDMFEISGIGDMDDAANLALVLKSGSLQAPMYIVSERVVSPTIGSKNITQGVISFVLGMLALSIYVLYHYKTRALIAITSLLVNASLIIIAMSLLGASLTLTGLAGIVLTMGMAIDSNIIVFERQNEGGFDGLSCEKQTMMKAYDLSLEPILDANVTTLLATIVLYNCGSVTLKGFALTLGLGVVCTIISSFFVSKTLSKTFLSGRV
ncbi:protein translocase subunit SecD [Photobacterium damselae]|uniref:protein translocase subunit SecD n=1 Tax=Photobacterium damselae TaxID=38293 RepID=UPI001EEEAEA0|nr:protein translocase subunit SecD [Photobacterium damselae]UKA04580.1 protein translocase subunit SecD [Photobacterium damselae subsp. damselae]